MKKLWFAAALGLAVVGIAPASAADLAAKPYVKAPPPPPPIYDWTGFYIGANGGWGESHSCVDFVTALGTFASGCGDRSGGVVGGQIGYRWQFNQFVVGVEGQGDWADLSNTRVSLFNPTLSTTAKTEGIGLITGQVGWAWNAALLYFKGGAAVTGNRLTIFDNTTGSVWSRQVARAGAAQWVSASNTASARAGRSVLNTTICSWGMRTTHSPWSIRALRPYLMTGSAKTWIWSPYALTIASVAGEHRSRPATDSRLLEQLELRGRPPGLFLLIIASGEAVAENERGGCKAASLAGANSWDAGYLARRSSGAPGAEFFDCDDTHADRGITYGKSIIAGDRHAQHFASGTSRAETADPLT